MDLAQASAYVEYYILNGNYTPEMFDGMTEDELLAFVNGEEAKLNFLSNLYE